MSRLTLTSLDRSEITVDETAVEDLAERRT